MHRVKAPPAAVQADYEYWCDFIETQVTFRLSDSQIHTREHESRVLLFALLIAEHCGVNAEEKTILCHAAVFHDTCREDDWLDVGHGSRAAEYYLRYYQSHNLTFYPWAYNIMAYHDRDDQLGEAAIRRDGSEREILLYHIFKDADALDRFRLGDDGLDVKFLRTPAAKELYDYAHDLWYEQFATAQDQTEATATAQQ